jgi:serine/threonine protein phosphatase PrpC
VSDSYSSTVSTWLLRSNVSYAIRHVSRPSSVLGTTRGRVRTENQDIAVVAVFNDPANAASFRACVVCDGLGGMEQGAQCAAEATSQFLAHLIATAPIGDRNRRLRDAVEHANREVYRRYQERGGTTIAAVLWTASGASAITVGDTRIYKQGETGNLIKLTVDDTIAGRIAELDGKSEGARSGGPFGHHLAQFIGQRSPVSPQILEADILVGDTGKGAASRSGLLITTDGIHRIGNETLQLIARHASSARELMQRLVSVSEWTGGADNATALYVSLNESPAAPSASRQPPGLMVQDPYGELLVVNNLPEPVIPRPMSRPEPVTRTVEKQKPEGRKSTGKGKRKTKRKSSKNDGIPRQAELKIRVTEHSE